MAYDRRWPARADAVLQSLAGALAALGFVRHPVVDLVMAAASPWARDCGWQPHGTP